MNDNPLKIIAADNTPPQQQRGNPRSARAELQAKMERAWLVDPTQFDPSRNSIERERIDRIKQVLPSTSTNSNKAVDLGAGFGEVSRHLRNAGWEVQAVDIASNALKVLADKGTNGIELIQDALPSTKLPDEGYDLVICNEVIGYLPPRDYRLLMAELSRLVKREGHVVCSTAIDIHSIDALERFGNLAETEFQIEEWRFSYHLLLIKTKNFFKTPQRFVDGYRESDIRKKELSQRSGMSFWWYRLNTSTLGGIAWTPIKWAAAPIVGLLTNNQSTLRFFEKICRFFWDEAGISHAIFIGKRRPLILATKADTESVERKGKRQVWE